MTRNKKQQEDGEEAESTEAAKGTTDGEPGEEEQKESTTSDAVPKKKSWKDKFKKKPKAGAANEIVFDVIDEDGNDEDVSDPPSSLTDAVAAPTDEDAHGVELDESLTGKSKKTSWIK